MVKKKRRKFLNVEQLIWFFGIIITFSIAELPYAITVGYVKDVSIFESIIKLMALFIPIYILRD